MSVSVILQAINCRCVSAAVFEARGCDLVSAVVGESEKAIRRLFTQARLCSPAIIIIDQIETLAPKRGSGNSATHDRILSCLLTELDGIVAKNSLVIVIATTCMRDELDGAILRSGRLDLQLKINLPDANARLKILQACCGNIPLADDVSLVELAENVSTNMSGADLQGICTQAAMSALRRDRQAGIVKRQDFPFLLV